MKLPSITLLFFLLTTLSANAQDNTLALVTYKFKFVYADDTTNMILTDEYEAVVRKNEVSYFHTKNIDLDVRNKDILVTGVPHKSITFPKRVRQYQNLTDKFVLSAEQCSSEGFFLVKDKMTTIEWKLSKNTKKIKNIDCFSAQAEYRGRVWTAWYAPSIPVSSGPWLLYGLPGMILEAEDLKKCVRFECMSVIIPAPAESKIVIPTVRDEKRNKNPITTAEFAKIFEKTLRNEEKMSIIKDANGGIASFSPAQVNTIEVYAFEKTFETKRFQQKLTGISKK